MPLFHICRLLKYVRKKKDWGIEDTFPDLRNPTGGGDFMILPPDKIVEREISARRPSHGIKRGNRFWSRGEKADFTTRLVQAKERRKTKKKVSTKWIRLLYTLSLA